MLLNLLSKLGMKLIFNLKRTKIILDNAGTSQTVRSSDNKLLKREII